MESLSKSHKRKHLQDGEGPEDRTRTKHQKHNGDRKRDSKSTEVRDSNREDNGSEPGNTSGSPTQTSLRKAASLLKALNEVLNQDGIQDLSTLLGEEAMSKCTQLRNSLLEHKQKFKSSSPDIPTDRSHDDHNVPKSLSASSVTPWTASTIPTSLPPLPAVIDNTLEEAAFRHTNTGAGNYWDLTYERLEWVGDAYLELTATLLISQTFPTFTPGKCSQLRERLVKNSQLCQYSTDYGFDKRAKLGVNFGVGDREKMTKIFGDIFEAYVAAVILSDPENGITKAQNWLKDIFGMTLRKDIEAQERSEVKWQNPMWKLVGDIPQVVQQQHVELNAKDRLQKALGAKGVKLTYREVAPETKDRISKLPLFAVGVFLTGWGEKDKQLGFGTALGKKEAGMKAAEMAMRDKRLMAPLLEKKRLHDEQIELEKKALKDAKDS
ncbi:hypothetical protein G7Y89_g6346 [Cudoniella acicularis]|uniref:RNase III domain-containing protein n=1 Tax=Cudoniella acicularis TaxID=354080 RepID=A0A8H4RLH8_9HELO|nr:hypothetical protein G7Y89_g6346 [Cudoniella acicularis]